MPDEFVKRPGEVLDYIFNYANWLAAGENIASKVITVSPSGLTIDSSSSTTQSVTVWLSGGTEDTVHFVTCSATTDQSRTKNKTIRIAIRGDANV